jgi:DNA primase
MRPDAKDIKSRIDLVEYLGTLGIDLKPVGAGGEYRGLCPFHDETAPSFQVNRRKGLWHCFGCGAGGDVISFLMKREGVGFREALDVLSGAAGLREPSRPENADRGVIYCAAADYWHKCLGGRATSAPLCRPTGGSASAGSYLERRGIGSPEIIERYGIGFAPGRTRTRDWLLTKGFALEEIEAAGLVNRRGLDSFFGRVTFPLVEDGGAVNVYGRSLSDRFNHMYLPGRRDVIFNIERVEGDHAVLTESIIDALTLVAVGFGNAVSSLSVHLTRRQVEALAARFARVDIAFDGDDAGAKGAATVAAGLRARGVDVRVAVLPEGSDVNQLVTEGASRRDIEGILRGSL